MGLAMATKVINLLLCLLSAMTADAVVMGPTAATTHGNVSAVVLGNSRNGLASALLPSYAHASTDATPMDFQKKHHCGEVTPAVCQCTTEKAEVGDCKADTESCAANFNRNDQPFLGSKRSTIFNAAGTWLPAGGIPGWTCEEQHTRCYHEHTGPYCQLEINPNRILTATYNANSAAVKYFAFGCAIGACEAGKIVHFAGMYQRSP
mmetsp:Transcript_91100/g.257944  ORF Transcript_91100/g.257944 Transcript_91100/m.257944 type:complete len:206 (+) Transcript_91100:55-672(+)